ncbi:probable serine/threonine-protein kinase DDB_G0277071 [Culex pipiens pallens]|uniref:probable serine/threonine-protein kinase DDB_G0277071 n=1 Tax=Culex pipiens pallens TaxID=42434 RepID=UPI0022AB3C8B|nr:probable serine/threonine-protein kinase DDB_G0277071 [Culex pipiens pallens]
MRFAPLVTLLISLFLVENESSQVENITSSEISPSFRFFLPGQVAPKTTVRTKLKPLTTKANSKNQPIIQWPTKASSRITTTTKRNGQTTKPIRNQQLQKTTPKRTQTTKAKGKTVTTTQKLAQMKKTTPRADKPPKPLHALFFNSPFADLTKRVSEPTLIGIPKSPSSTNFSSFDSTMIVGYGITFAPTTSTTTEDYEDYGNLTTTEEPELYDDLSASNNTAWTVSLPTMVPDATTVEEVTRKRLKRRKTTTIDPALTTRRRLKRRKTTTVGPENV